MVFELISELRNSGMGIVLTTHLMDDAQRLADYVYIIDAGRNVAEGTVAQLLQHRLPAGSRRDSISGPSCSKRSPAWISPEYCPTGVDVTRGAGRQLRRHRRLDPRPTWPLSPRGGPRAALCPSSMSLEARSLEDVFLDISGREIR